MRSFTYDVATDTQQAIELAARTPSVKFLGGGTNLVDLMRLGVETPEALIDVTHAVPDSVETAPEGGLQIGAGVRNSDLAADPRVRDDYPALSLALLSGASGQLRNMATVGGNLLQRTRCLYFQDISKPCNKRDPGSGCPARSGIHRDLAILGTSEHCIATHPSDLAVALAALDAQVHVSGVDGDRALAMDDLYRLPGDDPSRDTTLNPGDLIVGVELPAPSALTRQSTYRKARDRASYAFAVGAVAAAVTVESDAVSDVRIALGAVAHRPWRARTAEAELLGGPATQERFLAAVHHELEAAELLPDNAFKAELAARLTAATLSALCGLDAGAGR